MLTLRSINTPTDGTIKILSRRITDDAVREKLMDGKITAVGFIQGPFANVVVAGDIAEKTSNVVIADIIGNCPQHITMIGVFGDTSSVAEALKSVETWEKKGYGAFE